MEGPFLSSSFFSSTLKSSINYLKEKKSHEIISEGESILLLNVNKQKDPTINSPKNRKMQLPSSGEESPSSSQKHPDIFKAELPASWVPGPREGYFNLSLNPHKLLRLISIIVSLVIGVIIVPSVMVLVLILVMTPRILCGLWVWATSKGKLTLLPLLDSFKVAGDEFYTVVLVLKGQANMNKIRDKIQAVASVTDAESSSLKYPSLRKKLVTKFGFHYYENQNEDFDLQNHLNYFKDVIKSHKGPAADGLSHSELIECLQDDFQEGAFISRKRHAPQWEVLVVPKFHYDGPSYPEMTDDTGVGIQGEESFYAIIVRAHSAILDKQTALSLLTDDVIENSNPQFDSRVPNNKFTGWERFQIILYAGILFPWVFFKTFLATLPKSYGTRKKLIGGPTDDDKEEENSEEPEHILSFTASINFESAISAKDASQTSIKSLLTSCTACVARNLVLSQDLPLPQDYRLTYRSILCPCSGQESMHNITLPSAKYSFPLDRLRDAYFAVGGLRPDELQTEAEKWINLQIFWFSGAFPFKLAKVIYKRIYRTNMILEVWPIAGDPCRILGNDFVTEVFAWNSIASTNAEYGITITTYANRLKANIISVNGLVSPKARRTILADEFIEEYMQICQPLNVKRSQLFLKGQVAACELETDNDNNDY